ncbi:MAG: response regulator [Bacteroidales bacterium]|nr:response regulator [Bacteroidales bacterium]
MMKVLVVEDDDASREYIEIILKKMGLQFKSSTNGKDALVLFNEYRPEVVLSDINMAEMDGITLLENIKRIQPHTIVVMLTAYNSEEYVVRCMRHGASNYLKKPIPKESITNLLRKYQTILKNYASEKKVSHFVKKNEFTLKIKTDFNLIPSVVNYLVAETDELFSPDVKLDIKLGIGELLMNAMEHGNLGISYIEKNDAISGDTLTELYESLLSDAANADKIVKINFEKFENYCQWTITDEGEGFNPELVPNPISDNGVMQLHGRGIFICKFQFDKLEYIGKGNIVKVTKSF